MDQHSVFIFNIRINSHIHLKAMYAQITLFPYGMGKNH